jgi:uncharacterized protein
MKGIDRKTGRTITGWQLFVSHAGDVLTTQLGSREKRRDFGSRCPELRGKNNGPINQMRMRAYVALAFADPENGLRDRFQLTNVDVSATSVGFLVKITGKYDGSVQTFSASV